MSIKTWKKIHYPVEAGDCPTDNLSLLKHALLKWTGLRKDVLKKHKITVTKSGSVIDRDDYFSIDTETCALCISYYDANNNCKKCPLYKVRKAECDKFASEDVGYSPYGEWAILSNPEPMIDLIEAALKKAEIK